MLNFHRISGMYVVIVSCNEGDQIPFLKWLKANTILGKISKFASLYILGDYCRVPYYVKHMEGIF